MPGPGAIAVVCASGGMDSCVCAAIAASGYSRLYFLHAEYGQRTQATERACFDLLARHFKAEQTLVCRLDHLGAIGGSSLTDTAIEVGPAEPGSGKIPTSYVPFRNAHFLTVAVSWAEVIGAEAVFIGAVEQDSSGYPDCRKEFYEAFQRVVELGTRPQSGIEILTPLIGMKKGEIVTLGASLGAPFEMTWSCYKSGDVACGACDSCALRMRAFSQAGIADPIPYAAATD